MNNINESARGIANGRSGLTSQIVNKVIVDDSVLDIVMALDAKVEKALSYIEMLLEDRTRPAEPKEHISKHSVHVAPKTSKPRRPSDAVNRFEQRVSKFLGGSKAFKAKLRGGIASMRIENDSTRALEGGALGKLRINDAMQVDAGGKFYAGSRGVDFHSAEELEQLISHIRTNYGYHVRPPKTSKTNRRSY